MNCSWVRQKDQPTGISTLSEMEYVLGVRGLGTEGRLGMLEESHPTPEVERGEAAGGRGEAVGGRGEAVEDGCGEGIGCTHVEGIGRGDGAKTALYFGLGSAGTSTPTEVSIGCGSSESASER